MEASTTQISRICTSTARSYRCSSTPATRTPTALQAAPGSIYLRGTLTGTVGEIYIKNSLSTSTVWDKVQTNTSQRNVETPTTVTANATLSDANSVILADTTSGAIDLTVYAPSGPRSIWVKKTAGTNLLRLKIGSFAGNIEGASANYTFSASGSSLKGSWLCVLTALIGGCLIMAHNRNRVYPNSAVNFWPPQLSGVTMFWHHGIMLDSGGIQTSVVEEIAGATIAFTGTTAAAFDLSVSDRAAISCTSSPRRFFGANRARAETCLMTRVRLFHGRENERVRDYQRILVP